jgi:aminoglycoside phosphotransferase family enzyme/predicted kinase
MTVLPTLIQQMLKPEFYPHPVAEPIDLIQTHISYVLLTGEYAYKVKKPVNFGFLDFTALAQRKYFCEEELRLNQRGAPHLYLEVLPITSVNNQLHLNGEGEPIEYVLKMCQFPQEALFIHLFEKGKLTEKWMEDLGRVVAKFHAHAQTNDAIRSFGHIARVREAIDQNYEQTEQYISGPQTQEQFDQTRNFTDQFFQEQQALFANRIASNRIRECHGDLHLGNICLWKDQILLFDCIEFNPSFRFVDVMYDVAFVVMDLEAQKRPDLANAFLNTYVEETGDWEGLQVLPLYLIRQAYVRAKVTSFLLDEPEISEEAKAEAKKKAAHYYQLAWQYTQKHQGQLILMSGLSGSGKSTVARYFARRLQAIHIRSDAVRKHLGGISLYEKGGEKLYTPAMTEQTYRHLLNLGIRLAAQGYAVILDAKYDQQIFRITALEQAQVNHLPFHIFYCTAPLEVLRDRLQRRKGDITDAGVDLLEQQLQTTQPFKELEQPYIKTLDTTQSLEALWDCM